jgi:hypothetical protein
MLVKKEELAVAGTGLALITAGAVWLWGPIPLIVAGVIVVFAAFALDFL